MWVNLFIINNKLAISNIIQMKFPSWRFNENLITNNRKNYSKNITITIYPWNTTLVFKWRPHVYTIIRWKLKKIQADWLWYWWIRIFNYKTYNICSIFMVEALAILKDMRNIQYIGDRKGLIMSNSIYILIREYKIQRNNILTYYRSDDIPYQRIKLSQNRISSVRVPV
jgi:hypothetical protein